MGLFGNSRQEYGNASFSQSQQEKKDLIDTLKKKVELVDGLSGVKGKGKSGFFLEGQSYKFVDAEDKYLFYPLYQPGLQSSEKELIERELNIPVIELDKSQYKCELVETVLPFEKDKNFVGEGILKTSPITICFKNVESGEKNIFDVGNRPENIAPMAEFFKQLGVKNYYNVLNVPDQIFTIRINEGNGFLASGAEYLLFRNNGVLTFLRVNKGFYTNNTGIRIAEVGIDEILYYKAEGSIRYEQMVSGSGGASNSYGGAIVGGLLFGAVGAIIGSRANETKTEITTKTVTHDTRILVLSIKRNDVVYSISIDLNSEVVLEWLIPEKQYDYVIQKRREMYEQDPMK